MDAKAPQLQCQPHCTRSRASPKLQDKFWPRMRQDVFEYGNAVAARNQAKAKAGNDCSSITISSMRSAMMFRRLFFIWLSRQGLNKPAQARKQSWTIGEHPMRVY